MQRKSLKSMESPGWTYSDGRKMAVNVKKEVDDQPMVRCNSLSTQKSITKFCWQRKIFGLRQRSWASSLILRHQRAGTANSAVDTISGRSKRDKRLLRSKGDKVKLKIMMYFYSQKSVVGAQIKVIAINRSSQRMKSDSLNQF